MDWKEETGMLLVEDLKELEPGLMMLAPDWMLLGAAGCMPMMSTTEFPPPPIFGSKILKLLSFALGGDTGLSAA
jgi:hypothetical protein